MTAPTDQRQAPQPFASPSFQKRAKLKFEVVAGAHQGAALLLDKQDYRIGSSPDADIVLTDSGVAPDHAVLSVEHGAVRIGATGAEVVVDNAPLPVSHGRRVSLPANFTLGGAEIRISDGEEPRGLIERLGRGAIGKPVTAAALLASVVLAVAMVEALRGPGLTEVSPSPETGLPEQATSGYSTVRSSALQTGSTADDAARELKARLDVARIETLRVSADNGRLEVQGKLSRQQAGDWAAIERWFDRTYGGRLVLTTAISPPDPIRAMPVLRIQAIWYGERPYVVMGDGERYFQGAILDSGWVIREIGEDRMVLTKDGETAALTYR